MTPSPKTISLRSAALVLLGAALIGLALVLIYTKVVDRRYTITGTVTRDGKPLQWKTPEGILIVHFAPVDREKNPEPYKAETDRSGAYTIRDIPPGKYLVAVQQNDSYPMEDLLQFVYGLGNSPLEYTVTGDDVHDIPIPKDLSRGNAGPAGPAGGPGRFGGQRGPGPLGDLEPARNGVGPNTPPPATWTPW